MIVACDKAFDKAKHYMTRIAQAKSATAKTPESIDKSKPKPLEKKEPASMKPVSIKLDLNRTRLSHILQLKHLVLQHPGTAPIQVHFQASTKSLAILHIEGQGGVTLSDQFKQKI